MHHGGARMSLMASLANPQVARSALAGTAIVTAAVLLRWYVTLQQALSDGWGTR